jgi:5'(3')-deoxyribonucleotidase
MDGPLADFERAIIETGQPGNVIKKWKGIFADLHVVPGAVAAVSELMSLQQIDVWVLTKCPDGSTYAASEKQDWLKRKFPAFEDHIILTPDKGAIGRPCDVLVDDHFQWANANNFPGTKIEFKALYAKDGSSTNNWPTVLERIRSWL